MTAEIISVGTEILLGQITDTNASFIASTLADLGINLYRKTVVGDNADRLAGALREALSRADVVILGGGLGPTKDDLTKETVAQVMGVGLVRDEQAEHRLRAFFRARGVPMPEGNVKQAFVFDGGTVFQNEHGTAPGVALTKDGKTVACLPGPPHEMRPMVTSSLVPYLRGLLGPNQPVLVSRVLKLAGIGESLAADRVTDLLDNPDPTVAPYAKSGEVHLRVTTRAVNPEAARPVLEAMDARIAERLGDYLFGRDEDTLQSVVLDLLRRRGWTLAGAESCTGGRVSDMLTNIAGSSDVYLGAVVSYANSAKIEFLGVREETLATVGAVSDETARQMAAGARSAFGADVGFGITGIAGPGGGTPEKPVGLVYVAIASPAGTVSREHRFRGERDIIKRFSAQSALTMLWNVLRETKSPGV